VKRSVKDVKKLKLKTRHSSDVVAVEMEKVKKKYRWQKCRNRNTYYPPMVIGFSSGH